MIARLEILKILLSKFESLFEFKQEGNETIKKNGLFGWSTWPIYCKLNNPLLIIKLIKFLKFDLYFKYFKKTIPLIPANFLIN